MIEGFMLFGAKEARRDSAATAFDPVTGAQIKPDLASAGAANVAAACAPAGESFGAYAGTQDFRRGTS